MKKRARPIEERPRQQVLIRHADQEALVDKRMAPLIVECWRKGIWTLDCFEGSTRQDGFIQFQTSADAIAFLNAACARSESSTSLYARAERKFIGTAPQRKTGHRRWNFSIGSAYDYSSEGEPAEFELTVSISFPSRDIPRMLRALRPAAPRKSKKPQRVVVSPAALPVGEPPPLSEGPSVLAPCPDAGVAGPDAGVAGAEV